jgi:hypothetical protein
MCAKLRTEFVVANFSRWYARTMIVLTRHPFAWATISVGRRTQ